MQLYGIFSEGWGGVV